ncbi:glycosyltransferase [Cellulomonas aerilata]|uniref:Glycosyl transferase n=1 Tax=Cellulomonas aerilata TaxID=515326 RepID=A0A512DDG0_9CELL|nr:glycosyltransferase [Cellulomonas aerilata]GEO34518.1 glycosyl transferase [Cellulomonas aerilata]
MAGILVHEWLSRTGGSEKVFDAMVEAFPDADVLALWNDAPDRRYPGRHVRETWLARTPLRRSKAAALALMPATWRRQPAVPAEWALVSTHLFAHHVSFAGQPADFRKYLYVHTPARYIWTPELDRRGNGLLPRTASAALRPLDRRRAHEAFAVAANSAYVRDRIASTWGVDATVIHPPVDVTEIQAVERWADTLDPEERRLLESLPGEYLLGASRFIPYKRLDLVIAAGEAAGLPVVLAGAGPLLDELVARGREASVPVHVLEDPSDGLLRALFQEALVYVFPAVEDFGIMPVEAMAAGTPVLTLDRGGAAESVVDGRTGAHWDGRPGSLRAAVLRAAACSRGAARDRAQDFSREVFTERLHSWMGLR